MTTSPYEQAAGRLARLLPEVPGWRLSPAAAAQLPDLLAQAEAAAAARDPRALRAAHGRLVSLLGRRLTGQGEEPTVAAPEPVRERINHLVHRLLPQPAEAQRAGESGAPGPRRET